MERVREVMLHVAYFCIYLFLGTVLKHFTVGSRKAVQNCYEGRQFSLVLPEKTNPKGWRTLNRKMI